MFLKAALESSGERLILSRAQRRKGISRGVDRSQCSQGQGWSGKDNREHRDIPPGSSEMDLTVKWRKSGSEKDEADWQGWPEVASTVLAVIRTAEVGRVGQSSNLHSKAGAGTPHSSSLLRVTATSPITEGRVTKRGLRNLINDMGAFESKGPETQGEVPGLYIDSMESGQPWDKRSQW